VAKTLKIIDAGGEFPTVDFLAPGTGFRLSDNGLKGAMLEADQIMAESGMASEVVDALTVSAFGISHDDAASRLQVLFNMLRKAAHVDATNWQKAPVYWQDQHATETGARFARIIRAQKFGQTSFWAKRFEAASIIAEQALDIVREHPWRDTAPGVLPAPLTLTKVDGSADKTRIHVPGIQHASPATHLYNYDLSVTTFSANQIAATAITLFSVAASVPAVGDIVYIGWNVRPGHAFVVPMSATLQAATGLTIVAEAWIGGAWVALTAGTQIHILPDPGTNYASIFGAAGEWWLAFNPGATWQTTAINAITAYWVRLRITTLTSWTTTGVTHASETCYTPQKPYFTIPAASLKGDAPPRVLFRMYAGKGGGTTPGMGTLSRVLFGAKKASVTAFDSQLQLHQYGLPAGWARTLGTDAAEEADPRCSDGYRVGVSFATDATMKVRDTLVGTSLWDDYEGTYQVFLIAEQVGGANADTKVKARFFLGSGVSGDSYVETDIAYLGTHDAGYEVVDLGSIRIPFGDAAFVDTMTADIAVQVFAQRVSGAGTLRLSRIVLIPTDVWYGWVDDDATRDVNGGGTTLKDLAYVDMDMDVLLNRTGKFTKVGANYIPIYAWHRSTQGATLEPATAYRIYMLPMHYPTTFGTGPFVNTAGSMVSIEAYVHNSYLTLRGAG
jgi:hypothetical protein